MSKGHQLEMYRYAAAKSLQSCPTLCNPIDGSPPGSAIPGILQARTLEWVAISFSSAWKWKVKVKSLSRVWLLATPWIAAYLHPWDFPGKSTEVGCHCLLRYIYIYVYVYIYIYIHIHTTTDSHCCIADSDSYECMCNACFPEPCQQFLIIPMSMKDTNNFL